MAGIYSTSSETESETSESDSVSPSPTDSVSSSGDECAFNNYTTPRKRRYKRSLHTGVNKRLANYYKQDALEIPHLLHANLAYLPDMGGNDTSNRSATTCTSDTDSETDSTLEMSISDESSTGSTITSSESGCSSISDTSDEDGDDILSGQDDFFDAREYQDAQSEENEKDHPLYSGCQYTYSQSYIMLMLFAMKHSISKEEFSDLIILVRSHLPAETMNRYVSSVYRLKEVLKKDISFSIPKRYKVCELCNGLIDNETGICSSPVCQENDAKTYEFMDLNIIEQLKGLLQDDEIYSAVKRNHYRDDSLISDITDGSEYRRISLPEQEDVINLTFTLNTDGVALFTSSKKGSLWPIYLAINEIPIVKRFSKKFILATHLHCHTEKPNMQTYMTPLMDTLNILAKGIRVTTKSGVYLLRAHLLTTTMDLPARAMVSNMKQFNGKFGCSICLHEGKTRPGNSLHRYWPFNSKNEQRTHSGWISDIMKAVQSKNAVRGIKGASPLVLLSYIRLPTIFAIDWMHGVLLGVTKSLLKLWLGKKHKNSAFYIGNKISLLNKRYLQIKIPDFICRKQRSLEDHGHWKATEYREWLLHFSMPVLRDVLPVAHYCHYGMLVTALFLLNQEQIHGDDIVYAQQLLIHFSKLFSEYYGPYQETMNVHLLQDLPRFVEMYGPLFTTSCFGFESMNSYLKRMVHGTRYINSQVSFAYSMAKAIPRLLEKFQDETETDIQRLAERLSKSFVGKNQDTTESALGKMQLFKPSRNDHVFMDVVLSKYDNAHGKIYKFHRLRTKIGICTCQQYKRTKENSYTVLLEDNTFAFIKYFISFSDNLFAVVETIQVADMFQPGTPIPSEFSAYVNTSHSLCSHIHEVTSKNIKTLLVPVSYIVKKCVYMEIGNNLTFVSVPPNLVEHN